MNTKTRIQRLTILVEHVFEEDRDILKTDESIREWVAEDVHMGNFELIKNEIVPYESK